MKNNFFRIYYQEGFFFFLSDYSIVVFVRTLYSSATFPLCRNNKFKNFIFHAYINTSIKCTKETGNFKAKFYLIENLSMNNIFSSFLSGGLYNVIH